MATLRFPKGHVKQLVITINWQPTLARQWLESCSIKLLNVTHTPRWPLDWAHSEPKTRFAFCIRWAYEFQSRFGTGLALICCCFVVGLRRQTVKIGQFRNNYALFLFLCQCVSPVVVAVCLALFSLGLLRLIKRFVCSSMRRRATACALTLRHCSWFYVFRRSFDKLTILQLYHVRGHGISPSIKLYCWSCLWLFLLPFCQFHVVNIVFILQAKYLPWYLVKAP